MVNVQQVGDDAKRDRGAISRNRNKLAQALNVATVALSSRKMTSKCIIFIPGFIHKYTGARSIKLKLINLIIQM